MPLPPPQSKPERQADANKCQYGPDDCANLRPWLNADSPPPPPPWLPDAEEVRPDSVEDPERGLKEAAEPDAEAEMEADVGKADILDVGAVGLGVGLPET